MVKRMTRENLARLPATDYNGRFQRIPVSEESEVGLPVLHAGDETGKRQLAAPCAGFRWAADGAATAPPPVTKAKSHRNTFWKLSAIWDTPASCSWSPLTCAWDAVRFAVSAPRDPAARLDPSRSRSASRPHPSPPLCLRTKSSARRTRRSGIRPVARDVAASATTTPASRRWPNVSWMSYLKKKA